MLTNHPVRHRGPIKISKTNCRKTIGNWLAAALRTTEDPGDWNPARTTAFMEVILAAIIERPSEPPTIRFFGRTMHTSDMLVAEWQAQHRMYRTAMPAMTLHMTPTHR